jgi:intracellular septation protein A
MLSRLRGAFSWVSADFAPLIAFWVLDIAFGIKPAIAGAVGTIILDSLWRLIRRKPFTPSYLLSSALTVVLGGIDLFSATPFMLKYEGVVLNVVTGLLFIVGARGPKPLLWELAEQHKGMSFPDRPDVVRFFQIMTLFWAAYFLLKAGFYLFIGQIMPLAQAMAVRSAVGTASLGAMALISIAGGRTLFRLCHRLRLLPPIEAAE